MSEIGTIGVYKGNICIKVVDTIDEAIVIDYIHGWNEGHIQLDIYYKGKLLRRLSDDCEFDEEIAYLQEQIDDTIVKEIRKEV